MANDWQVPKRSNLCCTCEKEFQPGATFSVALFEQDESYQRLDYCADCQVPDDPAPIGCWKARWVEPAEAASPPFDREAMLAFFQNLDNDDAPRKVELRFVLALLLWRKKVLKLQGTTSDDAGEIWQFIAPRDKAEYQVVRPDLDESRLEQLSLNLESLLAGQAADTECLQPQATPEPRDA